MVVGARSAGRLAVGTLAGAGVVATLGIATLGAQAWFAGRRATDRVVRPDFSLHAVSSMGAPGEPLRVALLGDSTVAGLGISTRDAWLGSQLAQDVARQSGRTVEVVGFGVAGARTGQVLESQIPRLAASGGPWDVVVAVVGGNDVTHLTPYGSLARDTRRLVKAAAVASGGAPVVVGGVPRFFDASGVPRPLRDVFDASSRRVADVQRTAVADAQVGARFVDIGVESSERYAGQPKTVSVDGFHPSAIGYGYWADALAPRVVDAAR